MKFTDVVNRISTGRALLLGMAFAAFYYFIVFDSGVTQKAQIAASQSHLDELQTQIQENQKKLDRAAIYKKTSAEVGSTINKLLSLIPEKFAMPDLMRIVSNEAKVAGSSLAEIRPGTTEVSPVAKEFDEVSLNIELNGSFLQHMVFLSNLTKIHQIVIIRKFDFNLEKAGHGEEAATVKMTAEIVGYRYRGAGGGPTDGKDPGAK